MQIARRFIAPSLPRRAYARASYITSLWPARVPLSFSLSRVFYISKGEKERDTFCRDFKISRGAPGICLLLLLSERLSLRFLRLLCRAARPSLFIIRSSFFSAFAHFFRGLSRPARRSLFFSRLSLLRIFRFLIFFCRLFWFLISFFFFFSLAD